MSVGRDAVRTLLIQGATLGIGMVTNILITRSLGPAGKGLLSFLASVVFVGTSVGGLGLQATAIQHLGKRSYAAGTVAATQIGIGAAAGFLCFPLLCVVVPVFGARIGFPGDFLPALGAVTLLSLLQLNLSGVMIGLSRIATLNVLQLLTPVVWFAAVIAFALSGAKDRVIAGYAWIAAQAVSPLVTLVWIRLNARPRRERIRACARDSLRFGLEAYGAGVLWILLLRADAFLLAYWRGATVLGIYSISVLLAELLWYLPRSLTLALSPRVTSREPEDSRRLTERAVRLSLASVAAAALGLIAICGPLIRLAFGTAFRGSVPPLLLLLPGILCGAAASPISLYFTQQRGRPRISAFASGLGLVLNLALNAWWIPAYGASGAAAASSCAYFLVAATLVVRYAREPGFSARALFLLRRSDLDLVLDVARSFLRRPIAEERR